MARISPSDRRMSVVRYRTIFDRDGFAQLDADKAGVTDSAAQRLCGRGLRWASWYPLVVTPGRWFRRVAEKNGDAWAALIDALWVMGSVTNCSRVTKLGLSSISRGQLTEMLKRTEIGSAWPLRFMFTISIPHVAGRMAPCSPSVGLVETRKWAAHVADLRWPRGAPGDL